MAFNFTNPSFTAGKPEAAGGVQGVDDEAHAAEGAEIHQRVAE